MEKRMGKIKDAIIKRLGGHTEEEWKNRLLAPPRYEVVTQFDVETLCAHVKCARFEADALGHEPISEIAKSRIIRVLAQNLENYVEFETCVPMPPNFDYEMAGKLRVVRPQTGKVKKYG